MMLPDDEPFYDMSRVSGKVFEGPRIDKIELAGVPVVVPAGGAGAERGGEELLRSLDLVIEVRNYLSHYLMYAQLTDPFSSWVVPAGW